ncbi:MAG: hypothetical protein K2K20_12020, partial [Lachnospiraceae bacterium]|nr:hypothetical protein [Lachnospiraceae bacterium]
IKAKFNLFRYEFFMFSVAFYLKNALPKQGAHSLHILNCPEALCHILHQRQFPCSDICSNGFNNFIVLVKNIYHHTQISETSASGLF